MTIAVGQSTKTFTVAASTFQHFAVGTLVEGGTLTAAVQDATGYELGTPSSVDVSIVIGMTVRFDLASYSVGESAGPLSFKMIARTGAGAPQPTADYGQARLEQMRLTAPRHRTRTSINLARPSTSPSATFRQPAGSGRRS